MNNYFLINDISFNDGLLEISSTKNLNNLLLSSKSLQLTTKIQDNRLNLKELIANNKIFLDDETLYELQCINDEKNIIVLDCAPVKGKEYICKDFSISFETIKFSVDIYINNLNRIKFKIKKYQLELFDCKENIQVENIQLSHEKLLFSLRFNDENQVDKIEDEMLPLINQVKIYLFDKELDNIFEINPRTKVENVYKFELDLKQILNNISDNLYLRLAIKGEPTDYQIIQDFKLKKIPLQYSNEVKYADISISNNKIIIKSIDKFKINPIINTITYQEGLIFQGFLNFDYDFIKYNQYNLNIVLLSKDKNYEIDKNTTIFGNNFEFQLTNEEILIMKKYSPDAWSIYLDVAKENDVKRYRLKFKDTKKKNILNKSLFLNDEHINCKAFLTKENNSLVLQMKNNITINRIMHILQKKNKLEIKYRTKENIEIILDNKQLSTIISNSCGTFEQTGFKKIGKQTFISYYKVNNTDEFMNEAKKNGIEVLVKTNTDYCISHIKELDNDTIYKTNWEKIQRSKKYKSLCNTLYNKLFLKMPLKKNRIMFESFLGRNVSGNPKYIYNQMVQDQLDKKYDLIWILNDLDEEVEGRAKKVKRKSLTYYYYMATSKFWIFNCRQADEIKKRKGNIYLQTWHGTPLKKLGMDMDSVSMAGQSDIHDYKKKFYNNSRRWDYLLAQNDYSREIFRSAFSFDKTILDGYPANDILYTKNNSTEINILKDKLGIPKDKKVLLYAPTWRDDNFYKKGHYRMSIQLDLDKMQKELGDEYVILLRMHYLITNNLNIDKYNGFVLDYSQGFDIQELYLVSDVLITDYSSVMFDYSNLKRPIIFFVYDIEQYRDSLRGFYFDFEEEAPGPLVVDTEGVIKSLKSLDDINITYEAKKKAFYDKFCHIDDGFAASNILNKIL